MLASGPLVDTITTDVLSDAFDLPTACRRARRALRGTPRVNEPNEPEEIVAERDRSVVTRRDGVIVKRYRRAGPAQCGRTCRVRTPAGVSGRAGAAACWLRPRTRSTCRTSNRWVTSRPRCARVPACPPLAELGRAYAALHEVPPPARGTPAPCDPERAHPMVRGGRCRRTRAGLGVLGVRRPGPDARVLARRPRALERAGPSRRDDRAGRLRVRGRPAPRLRRRRVVRPVPARTRAARRLSRRLRPRDRTASTP